MAEVTADEECAALFIDVIFLGDEWKPNRFLLALMGLIVAVGGGFLLIEGEDVDAFADIRLAVPDDWEETEFNLVSGGGSLTLAEGATTPTIALGIIL